jgi:hypothetical protein
MDTVAGRSSNPAETGDAALRKCEKSAFFSTNVVLGRYRVSAMSDALSASPNAPIRRTSGDESAPDGMFFTVI